jgi:protoporphyrinogen oxidase
MGEVEVGTSRRSGSVSRRDVLAAFLGAPVALAAGCGYGGSRLPPAGEIMGADDTLGHRLRDARPPIDSTPASKHVGVAIVGGGVAGLSAAWRLARGGCDDFLLVELESEVGGTARSGSSKVSAYPWGAHYLPLPTAENRALVTLLDEMGILEGRTADGQPIAAEQFLCREPEERLFYQGAWHEGLFPEQAASDADRAEMRRFRRLVDGFVTWRDAKGRPAFAIPTAAASDDAEIAALDRITMADWLDRHDFHAPLVRWEVNYACRDDYGATIEQTSAWAGLFYFASRVRRAGDEPQPLLTWPEGNGRIVAHLRAKLGGRVETGWAVLDISPGTDGSATSIFVTNNKGEARRIDADQVVFAAPQFTAPFVVRGLRAQRGEAVGKFEYGSWMVANLHLSARPRESSFPMAWDNVAFDSPSLGYVVATHQRGVDHGPTVLTYYFPLLDDNPRAGRTRLLSLGWSDWADVALSDLERMHPDIRPLVDRLDVMRWGHAMIRPSVGFRFGPARAAATRPYGNVHFAHSDLSGMPLFEEAFYHGLRAAEEVLEARNARFESLL